MIDPLDALAFSVHANKGVYALLLGSGLSRAARIPTGWEITLELVRKVAALEKADCEPDPVAWFLASKGRAPDYSELLDSLARTPSERQQLLRPYWEPTESERDEGAKSPTKAHHAIAEMMKSGYVRVVITTNFDRLMEMALAQVGVNPTVLSTVDHIDGALPLIHTGCTIVKVHGDYMDTRIRNTAPELASYPRALNRLLDRIFDEFGLIVAGWSADWDEALRNALTRTPSRRFSTYWTSRGAPSTKAQELIARRSGTLVTTAGADELFSSLLDRLQALEDFSKPHPLSSAAAVASLKKYLSEQRYRIALDELVAEAVARLQDAVATPAFTIDRPDFNGDNAQRRLLGYEAASEILVAMAFVAGRWSERDQLAPWCSALARLATRTSQDRKSVV